MNKTYERMKKLLEAIGLNFGENTVTNAEIYAYSKGLTLIEENIKNVLGEIFFEENENATFIQYCKLLNIDSSGFLPEELISLIKERLSRQFVPYSKTEFDRVFNRIGSGSYEIDYDTVYFNSIDENDFKELGKFVNSYMHIFTKLVFDGSGLTFDEWDVWNQTFNVYDSFEFPFSMIDTLRRSYEQHE